MPPRFDPVVVDHLDAGLVGGLLDTGTRRRVDGVDDQDLDAVTDHVLRDRGELVLVTLGVLDVGGEPGLRERLLQERGVVQRVARRRGGVGQDHADLAASPCRRSRSRRAPQRRSSAGCPACRLR